MPRIAAAFAWLGVIAIALATNISRYPLVTQMAQNAYRADAAESSKTSEGKLAASPDQPAIAAQPAERQSPPAISQEEPASTSASPAAFSPQMTPIDDAPPAAAVDPLDLGNGVRRLPPVD